MAKRTPENRPDDSEVKCKYDDEWFQEGRYEPMVYGEGKEYLPTITEQKILDVILDKQYLSYSVPQKAKVAGVGLATWYRAMDTPNFVAYYKSLLMAASIGKASDMLDAVYNYGMSNAKNTADRIAFLQYVGVFQTKREININKKSITLHAEMGKATTEELIDIVRETLKQDPKLMEAIKQEMVYLVEPEDVEVENDG